MVQLIRPDVRKASEIAAELVARAEERGSPEYVAEAVQALAIARMLAGDSAPAAQSFDRAWALWESVAKHPTENIPKRAGLTPQFQPPYNRVLSGWNLWFPGYPDQARERLNTAFALVNESRSKIDVEAVQRGAVPVFGLLRELDRMRESAETAVVLSTELGNVTGRAVTEIMLGWADTISGDLDGGIARMRLHLSEYRATGCEVASDYFFALIATALGRIGRFDEGLGTIDKSFPIIERTGQRNYEAEVYRLKGELLLAQDASNAALAEHSFRAAIDISRGQKAKSWELRATTSLARLLRDTNRQNEARPMLAGIYDWFTEGFDTADLKDAKALLEELN